jgi:hypothetical protein
MHIRTWLALFSLCMIAAVLLSGCLDSKKPQQASTAPPGVFVDYQRSGGFAGLHDRVVIFDNGVTLISTRSGSTETRLNLTELERIGNLFEAQNFASLDGNYTSRRGGADLFQYTISFRGKTVHTEDTAIPPALQPIIEEMNRILALETRNLATITVIPRFTL